MDRVYLDANILFSAAYQPINRLRDLWRLPNTTLLESDPRNWLIWPNCCCLSPFALIPCPASPFQLA